MKIYGLEKLSLVDYDGYITTTVFTGACNFRCPFCHNSALVLDETSQPEYPQDEFFDYLQKRKGILEAVCITGGEPTLQKDLPKFCEKIKSLNYKVKLDTNGTNFQLIKTLNENGLIDYFAMDIKTDKEQYAKAIGLKTFDTTQIEKSVEYFLSGKADYEFRTTLVKELHNKENIMKIGIWLKGAKKYFLQKFKNSENCISQNLTEVPIDTAKEYAEILRHDIINVALRGYDIN